MSGQTYLQAQPNSNWSRRRVGISAPRLSCRREADEPRQLKWKQGRMSDDTADVPATKSPPAAQDSSLSFSHTADYTYIDSALKARWAPFSSLIHDVQAFVPRKEADFAEYRASEFERL